MPVRLRITCLAKKKLRARVKVRMVGVKLEGLFEGLRELGFISGFINA